MSHLEFIIMMLSEILLNNNFSCDLQKFSQAGMKKKTVDLNENKWVNKLINTPHYCEVNSYQTNITLPLYSAK